MMAQDLWQNGEALHLSARRARVMCVTVCHRMSQVLGKSQVLGHSLNLKVSGVGSIQLLQEQSIDTYRLK